MAVQFKMTDEQIFKLKEKISEHKKKPGPLMPTLHDAQEIFGCITLEVQKIIASELDISVAKINGVVTFYSHFSIEPKGKHVCGVCLGTACYVKGSQAVIDAISEELNIKPGETTEDGLFTLKTTRCVGACGLAPVMSVGDKIYGNVDVHKAKEVIKQIKQNETK